MCQGRLLSSWVLCLAACTQLSGQAVISAHAGVVNYSEGAVFLDDQALNQSAGTFPSIKEGSTLRTDEGRAEVLLTPGVYLRLDRNSSIRMVSGSLSNTQVEFLSGAVILDSKDASPGNSVALKYKTYQVRFPKPGLYRLDSMPGVMETYSGEAEVGNAGEPSKAVDGAHQFFFDIGIETNKYGGSTADNFSEWAAERNESIEASNRAAQSATDPADMANSDPFSGIGGNLPLSSGVSGPLVYGTGGYSAPLGWPGTPGGAYSYNTFGYYSPYANPLGFPLGYSPAIVYVYPRLYGYSRIYGRNPVLGHTPGSSIFPRGGVSQTIIIPHPTVIPRSTIIPHTSIGIGSHSPMMSHPGVHPMGIHVGHR